MLARPQVPRGRLPEMQSGASAERTAGAHDARAVDAPRAEALSGRVDRRSALVAACRGDDSRMAWLDGLPVVVADLCRQWRRSAAPPLVAAKEGSRSSVVPVRGATGGDAVLKVAMPHMEGAHEFAGLPHRAGSATVRLLDAGEAEDAVLLERCVPALARRRRRLARTCVARSLIIVTRRHACFIDRT